MQVASNNFDRLWIAHQSEIQEAIVKVGRSGWYILGQAGASFEDQLATCCGRTHAIGCGNA
jgi:dTDP-4-amino-4,6-dideoxygalactose transaminase